MVANPPWMLVGPWYRWARPGVTTEGRGSAPALQKFASDNFVNEFLSQPQHSLKFDPDLDQVFNLKFEAATLSSGPLAGKAATLYPGDKLNPGPSRTSLVPSGMRKLFLDSHSRHYLVVCELHCDLPGFPSATSAAVCQAGFVVRRRYLSYPASAVTEARDFLRVIIERQAELADLEQTAPSRPRAAKRRAQKIQAMVDAGTFDAAHKSAVDNLNQARAKLEQWRNAKGLNWILQGWAPGTHKNVGSWQIVEDTPQQLTEATFPLYPVFANPAQPTHDARGRAMFFGLVPTSSFDIEASGKARFDDQSVYEIRCFVRRHDPNCPRSSPAPDCHGPLTWSAPTERYQLASHFDVEGTSNRPITIQMPNLADLAAQAIKRPFGKYSPVKVIQPQAMQPPTNVMSAGSKALGGFQICFFSIPLITIVAMFVLNIFLPIVVLIFNLWFLLAFKFCIPPSISAAGGLQAELNALPPSVDIDASFSVSVDVNGDGVLETATTALVNADLNAGVKADIEAGDESLQGRVNLSGLANSPLRDLNSNNVELGKLPQDASSDPSIGVDFTASLEFEAQVEPQKTA